MALTNPTLAEEAVALPPVERADLTRLLLESLRDDPRTEAEIKSDLADRLEALLSGKDTGLTFAAVFGSPQ